MNLTLIIFLISVVLSQSSGESSSRELHRMCKMGCKDNRRINDYTSRVLCREFTMSCNLLFREDRSNGLKKTSKSRQYSPSTHRTDSKRLKRNRKYKRQSKDGGMAVSTVGNAYAVAGNGRKILKVKGHDKPKAATYGSGKAFASDGDKAVFSSNGKKIKQTKGSKKETTIYRQLLDWYRQQNNNSLNLQSIKGESSETENDKKEKPDLKDDDGDFSNHLIEKNKKFKKAVEARNKQIMDNIMKDLGMSMG